MPLARLLDQRDRETERLLPDVTPAERRRLRAGLARRERDANDRRKILVTALPAVPERIAPLFAPMERAAMAVLAKYRDDELALLLDFLATARDAALTAMAQLRALPEPRPKRKLCTPK